MSNKYIVRKTNIVVQELQNEILIYDLAINKAFCLNETSALVYQLCDGTKTIAEISDLMNRKLKTKVSEDLVWLALDELKKRNLLENTNELTVHFDGLSRREAIKKVGMASMIALPLISSLVAPTVAQAGSGRSACTPNAPGCVANGSFATSTQPSDAACSSSGVNACCSCARSGYIYVNTTQQCSVSCT